MRICFLIAALFCIGSCSSLSESETKYVGLWQFPERFVWVQIDNDGNVFQCRIDVDGSVISSAGKLLGNFILWSDVWKQDEIHINGNTIFLKGPYGEFGFEKSERVMVSKCQNPLSTNT